MNAPTTKRAQVHFSTWAEDLNQYIPNSKVVEVVRNRHGNWSVTMGPRISPMTYTFCPKTLKQFGAKQRTAFGWRHPTLRFLDEA